MHLITDALPPGTRELANTDDVLAAADTLRGAPALALHFPKWTDGRAYSQAVLLRNRLRYGGQIIATGEVVVDMLPLLRRCGFDALRLRADQDAALARRMLATLPDATLPDAFPGHYQTDLQTPARAPVQTPARTAHAELRP